LTYNSSNVIKGDAMDKTNNYRIKHVGTNLEQFEISSKRVSDTNRGFPEDVRDYRYRSTDYRKIWDYLGLLFSMLLDSFKGRYKLPKKTTLVLILAFLYLISPVDIFPDILPVIGLVDDVAVMAFAFSFIKDDLENYRIWKMSN
jgi:uncharacterized membrane protein YkvA (DUF1232 family)